MSKLKHELYIKLSEVSNYEYLKDSLWIRLNFEGWNSSGNDLYECAQMEKWIVANMVITIQSPYVWLLNKLR